MRSDERGRDFTWSDMLTVLAGGESLSDGRVGLRSVSRPSIDRTRCWGSSRDRSRQCGENGPRLQGDYIGRVCYCGYHVQAETERQMRSSPMTEKSRWPLLAGRPITRRARPILEEVVQSRQLIIRHDRRSYACPTGRQRCVRADRRSGHR